MGNCASSDTPPVQQQHSNTLKKNPENKPNEITSDDKNNSKPDKKPENKSKPDEINHDGQTQPVEKDEKNNEVEESRVFDPINLDEAAPRPTTASPHALPRGLEDVTFDDEETKKSNYIRFEMVLQRSYINVVFGLV